MQLQSPAKYYARVSIHFPMYIEKLTRWVLLVGGDIHVSWIFDILLLAITAHSITFEHALATTGRTCKVSQIFFLENQIPESQPMEQEFFT